jgi:uncharacterized protein (DUF736 family)
MVAGLEHSTRSYIMSQIGSFTRSNDGTYTGTIKTLAIDAKARLVPSEPASTSDKTPDLRVLVSGVEIGAAWRRTSKDDRTYHSVKLDDSIRAAALSMGGDWHDLGGALADGITEPVALQPLSRIDDAGDRAWAADWVAALLARESVTVTPELKEHLWSALTSLASAPVAERTITGLSVLLQSNALKQALQPYTLNGPWGRLLDAETERLGEADVQAFETEGLIGASAAPAVLSYLFHRIEDRFDGRPTLLIIDEGWLALDDKGFARQLREWLKTLRKKNASVIFATQSLADIDGSANWNRRSRPSTAASD